MPLLAQTTVVPRWSATGRHRLFVGGLGLGTLEFIEVQQHPSDLRFHQEFGIGDLFSAEVAFLPVAAVAGGGGSGVVDGGAGRNEEEEKKNDGCH